MGKATWNYKAYENDASGSVHNPAYIMAGLKKAEQMALSVGGRFMHAAAKTPVKKNTNAHVAGRIVNGDNSAATGAKVVLLRGTTVIGTTLSDATGNFAHVQGHQDLQELQGEWLLELSAHGPLQRRDHDHGQKK